MKIRYLLEDESEPREVIVENFDFEEYKQILLGEKADKHGNSLTDIFIGNRSYKTITIKWLEIVEEEIDEEI